MGRYLKSLVLKKIKSILLHFQRYYLSSNFQVSFLFFRFMWLLFIGKLETSSQSNSLSKRNSISKSSLISKRNAISIKIFIDFNRSNIILLYFYDAQKSICDRKKSAEVAQLNTKQLEENMSIHGF